MESRASCGHASRSCLYSRCLWTHSPLTTWRSWSSTVQQLLEQNRVVFPDAVFPVWVDQRTLIYIRIGSSLESIQKTGLPVEQCPNAAGLQCPQQWGGIAILKNMVRLHFDPHSSVRIKPIKSTPKVVTSIYLQPLQPQNGVTQGYQTPWRSKCLQFFCLSFQVRPRQPACGREGGGDSDCLPGLAAHPEPRTTSLSDGPLQHNPPTVPAMEGKVEFALTVLKSEPEPESEEPDQLFLLALSDTDMQVTY
ncbi:uncharacterized protein LOC118941198 isoform X2 [Oncorhynchus mykiss]|uniref:uncharacterized protein LOC118941198 isoform X2 n=1 Tax=Oncorhynchus mykiss TaxID=8022 RepID=UPI001878F3CD|nr:uncharacterized protein LOC118941198 isoform X2 [Oncorhynchus mykiss]